VSGNPGATVGLSHEVLPFLLLHIHRLHSSTGYHSASCRIWCHGTIQSPTDRKHLSNATQLRDILKLPRYEHSCTKHNFLTTRMLPWTSRECEAFLLESKFNQDCLVLRLDNVVNMHLYMEGSVIKPMMNKYYHENGYHSIISIIRIAKIHSVHLIDMSDPRNYKWHANIYAQVCTCHTVMDTTSAKNYCSYHSLNTLHSRSTFCCFQPFILQW
jgi:hypothetical protein